MTTRFAILQSCAYLQTDGFILEFTSNTPCHLWLNYTNIEPVTHMEPVFKRGLQVHCNPRFCFVKQIGMEQNEPGDTLIHSYWLKGLSKWENVWCYLSGEIAGITSPSTSPIMRWPLNVENGKIISYEVGFATSGKAVSWNRPRAQRFNGHSAWKLTGVQIFCYGFGPDYSVRISIYKSSFFEFPTGSYLTSQTYNHIPWKRTFPRVGYFYFTFPPIWLEAYKYYHIVMEGDPNYPDTDVFWWSRGNLPPLIPGENAHIGERANGGINWRRDLDSYLDFSAWAGMGYSKPCEP